MNNGARRLRELFPRRGGQRRVAEAVGVPPGVVSCWYRSLRRPDTVQRAKLEDLYGIGWRLWDTDDAGESLAADQMPSGTEG